MSGLLNRQTKKSLPLRSSSVFTEIKGFTARTTAFLTYYNDHRKEIEGLFVFPLEHTHIVAEFEAVVEGHYIFADIKHTSDLIEKTILHRDEEMHDGIFNVSIGKIPPWIIVEIQVTTVCEVGVLFYGDALRYTLPQTFSPKVTTYENDRNDEPYKAVSTLGYSFQLEILIEAPCLLCGVQSNTHQIQVDAPPLSQTGSKLRVSLPDDFASTDSIFELLMFLCRPREPYIIIEEPKTEDQKQNEKNPISNIMSNPILMLSYSPDISNFEKELHDNSTNQVGEFILMINFSTSLNATSANQFLESCMLLLKCLPSNCFFNLLVLTSSYDTLFTTSQKYSQENVDNALAFLSSLKAHDHNASLLEAFTWLYQQEDARSIPRQVFILTSGNINNSNELSEQVSRKHHIARCFTFHFGSSNKKRTLESIATVTKGQHYNISEGERPHKKVIECLERAIQPAITNLKVAWILPDAYDVIYTPENLSCLYLGDRMNLYAILANKEAELNNREKPSGSMSSVKEFWFDDFDPFEELVEKQCSSHDLLTNETTEENTPGNNNISQSFLREHIELPTQENENEVFLTEEEVSRLEHRIGWNKRSSLDRVQSWKVSKFPENNAVDLVNDKKETFDSNDVDRLYSKYHTNRRKKSSDGGESIGSSNSQGSNMSSGSHLAFPGYPTRLSSCRSVEARSPHVPKHSDDPVTFTFSDHTKDRYTNMSASNEKIYKEREFKARKKLTQALIDEHANTHLLDQSNEDVIERLLESITTEKRHKLDDWLRLQEEMTNCNWPTIDQEQRKCLSEKIIWKETHRDSGIGHRSLSEPRTSDMEDEHCISHKKSGQFSKSSSGYFEQEANEATNTHWVDSENRLKNVDTKQPTRSQNFASIPDLSKKPISETKQHKKKIRPRFMWNAIIDKVKTLTTAVTERSGETNFKVDKNLKIKEKIKRFDENFDTKNSSKTELSKDSEQRETVLVSTTWPQSEAPSTNVGKSESSKKYGRSRQRYIRNRPRIENSRTISTSSMFEIGQSEIGDVDNLHLLPSHALIYLSGQFGKRSFKRIIPFQLVFSESKQSTPSETTVHQLAAKSIIRDLEIQMDQDEMLVNSGRNYVKNLISDVSSSAHIMSKYTAVVTIDDKSKENEILSVLKYNEHKLSFCSSLSRKPFVINNDLRRSVDALNLHDKQPLYEINSEKSGTDSTIWHTKLTLKRPYYSQQKIDNKNLSTYNFSSQTKYQDKTLYMKMVDLMISDGNWSLTHLFAEVLAINFSHLRESCPFADPVLKKGSKYYENLYPVSDVYESVWATTIALNWLHIYCNEHRDEWALIEIKAKQWLKRQKLPKGFMLEDCFLISQQTLKILKSTSRRTSVSSTTT
ncbi:uncharacterized protein LOC130645639 [Hydractinia symbiolongicarpus]|uniref:uncharacterized protein LOC130645639 n=1 Tax=Hydractinia symbiolongicarpus TaxID=13093 RepID=UPI00254C2A02|nr:uncharacterized protein LOC130645639 [Hydractinia symbiolongicarpus]